MPATILHDATYNVRANAALFKVDCDRSRR
jgi:hypothetical protein